MSYTDYTTGLEDALDVLRSVYGRSFVTRCATNKSAVIETLYQEWYTKSSHSKKFSSLINPAYEQVYKSVHGQNDRWEKGWVAQKVSSRGRVIAYRGKEQRLLNLGDYMTPARPGLIPLPGMELLVTGRRESAEQPGFWITFSPAWCEVMPSLLRIYWNTSPEGGVHLVELVTSLFPQTLAYSLKLPVNEEGYQRADTVVLYMQSQDFAKSREALHQIYQHVTPALFPEEVPWSQTVAPGVSLAEDPPDQQESFGLHRCRMIVEGLKSVSNDGSEVDAVRAVEQYMVSLGFDPERPYCNPNSTINYDW